MYFTGNECTTYAIIIQKGNNCTEMRKGNHELFIAANTREVKQMVITSNQYKGTTVLEH
jgi:hypothetical protein